MATQRFLQNNLLLWLDGSIDENAAATEKTLEQLRGIIGHAIIFNQPDTCVEFLQKIKTERVLIITSGNIGAHLVQEIHWFKQVKAIYIFCGNVSRHQSWTTHWSKIRGVYNRIEPICEALQLAVKRSNEDLIPFSFLQQETDEKVSEVDLNRLEPSFMYTILFKRILLQMDHKLEERQALVKFCRIQLAQENPLELKILEEFNRDYHPNRAIWWYTRECFLYQMLNRALRLLQSDIIVDMGFFMHDLHRQLEQLHQEQFQDYHGPSLILYRGQGLSTDDVSKMKKNRGGLIAFNSFLSTSKERRVPEQRARLALSDNNTIGLLFIMSVDPKIPSAIFADIEEHSFIPIEKEILFSMHTVFRIGEVIPMDESEQLFEVCLTLTRDDDPELRRLMRRMEKDIGGGADLHRVGRLLLDVGELSKAEELYLTLLERSPSERNRGSYYHCLGLIKNRQGHYQKAVEYYKQAISIEKKVLSPTDSRLATSYNNLGSVYNNMREYTSALLFFNKAFAIRNKILPADHPDIAQSYNNIGSVHKKLRQYSQALSYLNKAITIQEKTLPDNHPYLATSYNNVGGVYDEMDEHSQALSFYKKALTIREKTLPANHPHLASSYSNIGATYYQLQQYSVALSYLQKALDICENSLPPGHPQTLSTLNGLKSVQEKIDVSHVSC